MTHLPLANSLKDVSQLVYGCMGLGGGWDQQPVSKADIKQAHGIIDTALDCGINLFDHADIYTFGKAEQAFGEVLSQRPELRQSIYLQSKCGIRFEDELGPKRYDFSAEWIIHSVEGILQRLKTDYLDLLLLHRPDPLMETAEVAEAFEKLAHEGKVKHFGVSNMHQHQITFLQTALTQPLVVNQIEMSLQQHAWLDEGITAGNPAGNNVNFTPGTLQYCASQKIQLQAWGSLCQGLYSGRNIDDKSDSIKATAALVSKLAAEYEVSREAILLGFLMRHPSHIQPVIGTTNIERIRACQQALSLQLSREHWYALFETARGQEIP